MRRAMVVDPAFTLCDDLMDVKTTPADALAAGLGALLNRVEKTFTGEGVLLLTEAAASTLGAPAELPSDEHGAKFAPVLDAARSYGWKVSELRPWTTFYRDGAADVHVGFLPFLDDLDAFPLRGLYYLDTLTRLARWHELTGSAFHGSPAVAAIDLMRRKARGKGGTEPRWCPSNRWEIREWEGCERRYEITGPTAWSRTEDAPAEIGYDQNSFYLAAAGTVELAAAQLEHTGRRRFDAKRAGFWLVEIGPWNERRLPDPAGYSPTPGPRWVTTPTLKLLSRLQTSGRHGGFDVLDSYTSPGSRLLKPWADTLRDLMFVSLPVVDLDYEGPAALSVTAKSAYKAAHGMVKKADDRGSVRRPDWYYGWLAEARCNLWSKLDKAAQKGKYPLRIDVDRVWYSTEHTDFQVASRAEYVPDGFTLGVGLGKCDVNEDKGFRVLKEVLAA